MTNSIHHTTNSATFVQPSQWRHTARSDAHQFKNLWLIAIVICTPYCVSSFTTSNFIWLDIQLTFYRSRLWPNCVKHNTIQIAVSSLLLRIIIGSDWRPETNTVLLVITITRAWQIINQKTIYSNWPTGRHAGRFSSVSVQKSHNSHWNLTQPTSTWEDW